MAEEQIIEALAERVHQAYLDTCHRLGWSVKPENAVPYAELSDAAKELDRATARAVLDSGHVVPARERLRAVQEALRNAHAEWNRDHNYIIRPDTVEQPKTVGDIRHAIEPLADDAQAFIAISGHGEDYAIASVDMSQQVGDDGGLTVGLEIHLGLFPEIDDGEAPDA